MKSTEEIFFFCESALQWALCLCLPLFYSLVIGEIFLIYRTRPFFYCMIHKIAYVYVPYFHVDRVLVCISRQVHNRDEFQANFFRILIMKRTRGAINTHNSNIKIEITKGDRKK